MFSTGIHHDPHVPCLPRARQNVGKIKANTSLAWYTHAATPSKGSPSKRQRAVATIQATLVIKTSRLHVQYKRHSLRSRPPAVALARKSLREIFVPNTLVKSQPRVQHGHTLLQTVEEFLPRRERPRHPPGAPHPSGHRGLGPPARRSALKGGRSRAAIFHWRRPSLGPDSKRVPPPRVRRHAPRYLRTADAPCGSGRRPTGSRGNERRLTAAAP